ncbi:hypothetical protein P152DRAFT_395925 [Eremomyces bilateralis CBS 781.70]|uniref:Mitochondrial zinc maintenance protein 1, mitochondrial n=1 Tax=Eremomyces bilateralis CBS 781.70 TaxID=1392243 RepID=A0A6G1G3X9_9PEZI|nr:uncharacterized protein P152DRAFT_395925 [Eremomyces bilateralis CBS 781.70]KAF1812805.1 hypothetical protein P152DRAFT_395925 [Eremomyces bilateralis CBS 781.70]
MALAAYRHLLRAARIAFEGDAYRLTAARKAARDGFESSRALKPDSEEAVNNIVHAEAVSKFLMENLVQGKAMDGEAERYKLRIHERTERGDNESIKLAGKKKSHPTNTKAFRS